MRHLLVMITVLILVAASISGCIISDDGNKPPKAFAGEDIEAEVGLEVIFSGSGLDDDGSIVRFRWDFDGDDVWDYTGEVGARIHVYALPGSYLATLEVEDDEGAKTRDTRWVNVTASVTITVHWTTGTGFRVHVPEGMDVTRMEADWSLEGSGPTPITRTFTHDAGLEKINNTTYAFDPGLTSLDEGQLHVVKVRLGLVVVASRAVEVVQTSDTEGQYDARYINELHDHRERGENSTTLWWLGDLSIESRTGWNRGHMSGNGTWNSSSNRTGMVTIEAINLTEVSVETGEGDSWGSTWWRYYGNGTVEQWDQTGYYGFAWVYDLERSVENGSLTKDDWRRVGLYQGLNETNGTFEWTRVSMGNQVRQNGEGELYEVLKVRSDREFESTSPGVDFILHNLTYDFDASRMVFENRTTFRDATQEVGFQLSDGQWSWRNTTWGGFLDDDGDGFYNPDPVTYDPELASKFTGPRPRVLVIGDHFTATNFYGVRLNYVATDDDKGDLQTAEGIVNVTGVRAVAYFNTTWGQVEHWFWVLEDGPVPGFVFEERVIVSHSGWGGGTYDRYRNILSVRSLP